MKDGIRHSMDIHHGLIFFTVTIMIREPAGRGGIGYVGSVPWFLFYFFLFTLKFARAQKLRHEGGFMGYGLIGPRIGLEGGKDSRTLCKPRSRVDCVCHEQCREFV